VPAAGAPEPLAIALGGAYHLVERLSDRTKKVPARNAAPTLPIRYESCPTRNDSQNTHRALRSYLCRERGCRCTLVVGGNVGRGFGVAGLDSSGVRHTPIGRRSLSVLEWQRYIKSVRQKGGRSTSSAKIAAARENGKRGGRPRRGEKSPTVKLQETQLRSLMGELGSTLPDDLTTSALVEAAMSHMKESLARLDDAISEAQEASAARKIADAHEHERNETVAFYAREIIEQGYKIAAMKHHPDVAAIQGDAEKEMKRFNEEMAMVNAAIVWLRKLTAPQT
jgi:hypothetical protein